MFACSLSLQALVYSCFLPFWSKTTPAVRYCSPSRTICPFSSAFNKKRGEGGGKQTNKPTPKPKTVRNWHLYQTHCHDSNIKNQKWQKDSWLWKHAFPRISAGSRGCRSCPLPTCRSQDKAPCAAGRAALPSPAQRFPPGNTTSGTAERRVGNSESAEIWFSSTLLNFC